MAREWGKKVKEDLHFQQGKFVNHLQPTLPVQVIYIYSKWS